jgi:hypothetical protein
VTGLELRSVDFDSSAYQSVVQIEWTLLGSVWFRMSG